MKQKMHQAVIDNNLNEVIKLLESGADVNSSDEANWTALHWASFNGFKEIVEVLLEHDADPDILDKWGDSALFDAALKGHFDTVKLLVQYNSKFDLEENNCRLIKELEKRTYSMFSCKDIIEMLKTKHQSNILNELIKKNSNNNNDNSDLSIEDNPILNSRQRFKAI